MQSMGRCRRRGRGIGDCADLAVAAFAVVAVVLAASGHLGGADAASLGIFQPRCLLAY